MDLFTFVTIVYKSSKMMSSVDSIMYDVNYVLNNIFKVLLYWLASFLTSAKVYTKGCYYSHFPGCSHPIARIAVLFIQHSYDVTTVSMAAPEHCVWTKCHHNVSFTAESQQLSQTNLVPRPPVHFTIVWEKTDERRMGNVSVHNFCKQDLLIAFLSGTEVGATPRQLRTCTARLVALR